MVLRQSSATGEIAGTVRDTTGGVLPGVSLTITHQTTGQERRVLTDTNGGYVAPSLPVGEYVIKAELPNFKTRVRQGVVLEVGRQIAVDLEMEVGEVNQAVTIEESAPLLQASNAATLETAMALLIQNQAQLARDWSKFRETSMKSNGS
jgi:hypothetical protein